MLLINPPTKYLLSCSARVARKHAVGDASVRGSVRVQRRALTVLRYTCETVFDIEKESCRVPKTLSTSTTHLPTSNNLRPVMIGSTSLLLIATRTARMLSYRGSRLSMLLFNADALSNSMRYDIDKSNVFESGGKVVFHPAGVVAAMTCHLEVSAAVSRV